MTKAVADGNTVFVCERVDAYGRSAEPETTTSVILPVCIVAEASPDDFCDVDLPPICKDTDLPIPDNEEDEDPDDPVLYLLEEIVATRRINREARKLARLLGEPVKLVHPRPFTGSPVGIRPPRDQGKYFVWRGRLRYQPNGPKVWQFGIPPAPPEAFFRY